MSEFEYYEWEPNMLWFLVGAVVYFMAILAGIFALVIFLLTQ